MWVLVLEWLHSTFRCKCLNLDLLFVFIFFCRKRYVAELAEPSIRGSIVGINEFTTAAGILFAYFIGYVFVHQENGWRWMLGRILVLISTTIYPLSLILEKKKKKKEEKELIMMLLLI